MEDNDSEKSPMTTILLSILVIAIVVYINCNIDDFVISNHTFWVEGDNWFWTLVFTLERLFGMIVTAFVGIIAIGGIAVFIDSKIHPDKKDGETEQ